jgi:hypothetical protein
MKIGFSLWLLIAIGLFGQAYSQDGNPPPKQTTPASSLPPAVSDVVRLAQSGVGDDVVIAYIKNSQVPYNLSANDVLALKNDGFSSQVITAMLNHDQTLRTQPPAPVYEQKTYPPTYQAPPAPAAPASPPVEIPNAPSVPNAPTISPNPTNTFQPPPNGSTAVQPPNSTPTEAIPASPGPSYYWVPGYWSWNGAWVWVGGRWTLRPWPSAVWVSGHWGRYGHRYVWVGGYWH